MAAGGYISGLLTAWTGLGEGAEITVMAYAQKYSTLFLGCAVAMLAIALLYLFAVPFLKKAHKLVASE